MEHVRRVEPTLYLDKLLPVRSIRRPHTARTPIGAEVVEPAALDQVLAERGMCGPRPCHVPLGVGRIQPDRWDEQVPARLAMGYRGVADADACYRTVKCSTMTARSMSSSLSPRVKLDSR